MDDELGTIKTLGKNTVLETTSDDHVRGCGGLIKQDRSSPDGIVQVYTGELRRCSYVINLVCLLAV